MAQLGDLMAALKAEVDRISASRAQETEREELSDILLTSIHSTLRDIKYGANSDEFQELTVLNFVTHADSAGHAPEAIRSYVQELSKVKRVKK